MVVDRKKILEQLAKVKSRTGKVRFLKKDSTTHLRVLEFKDEDGSKIFAKQYVQHRKAGVFGGNGDVCRAETFDKPCAFCQVNLVAEEEGEQKPFNYRTQYLVNAFDIDDQANRVVIFQLPTTCFELIAKTTMDDEYENVLEAKEGRAFTITKAGSGKDTEYGCRPMANPYPVAPSVMKQVKNPLEVIDDPGLDAQLELVGFNKEDLFGEDFGELGEEDQSGPSKEPVEPSEEPSEEPKGDGIPMGARVSADFDGEVYEGETTSIDSEGKIVVTFDDGDVQTCDADELTFLEDDPEPSKEPEPSEGGPVDTITEEKEPLCHGKEKYFEEGSDCDDCPWLTSCRNEIQLHPAKGKETTKTTTKRRGRPKGSTTKTAAPEEKSTSSALASKIVGRSKKK